MNGNWVEISLSRIQHNVGVIRSLLAPRCQIIAVVKSDAYGHGLIPVALTLARSGIRRFAVTCVEEGVNLRQVLPEAEILVLDGGAEDDTPVLLEHRLTISVFEDRVVPAGLRAHLKIDTGMNRLGINWRQAAPVIERLGENLTGVYSHLANSEGDPEFSRKQIERFLKAIGAATCIRHICNSAGLQYREGHLEAVRTGLALYGIANAPCLLELKPVLSWKTRILSIAEVAKGERVGYGGTFQARRKTRLGILPVGYADGYNRLLSNQGKVRIRGHLLPVAGMISMNLTAVDVTEFPEVRKGEVVSLLEADSESPISATAIARRLKTIPYEVFTSIHPRIERVCQAS